MDSQTVIISLLSGFVIYVLIELDKKYFSSKEQPVSLSKSSLRIASMISLIVYITVTYFKCSDCKKLTFVPKPVSPSMSSIDQQILREPFNV